MVLLPTERSPESFFFIAIRRLLRSTLFPYTTLFRSRIPQGCGRDPGARLGLGDDYVDAVVANHRHHGFIGLIVYDDVREVGNIAQFEKRSLADFGVVH